MRVAAGGAPPRYIEVFWSSSDELARARAEAPNGDDAAGDAAPAALLPAETDLTAPKAETDLTAPEVPPPPTDDASTEYGSVGGASPPTAPDG